jgi:hypothetical protein
MNDAAAMRGVERARDFDRDRERLASREWTVRQASYAVGQRLTFQILHY